MSPRTADRINRFMHAWRRVEFIPLRETDLWKLKDAKDRKIFTNKTQMHKILAHLKQQGLIINIRTSHKRSVYMLVIDQRVQRECMKFRNEYRNQVDFIISTLKSYKSFGARKEDLFNLYLVGIFRVSEVSIKMLEMIAKLPDRFNLFKQYFIIEIVSSSNRVLANMWNLEPAVMEEALNTFHKIVDKEHALIMEQQSQ
ncbi:MAG: hypothetical protein QXU32_04685 [Nitrososphaerales archaeon]